MGHGRAEGLSSRHGEVDDDSARCLLMRPRAPTPAADNPEGSFENARQFYPERPRECARRIVEALEARGCGRRTAPASNSFPRESQVRTPHPFTRIQDPPSKPSTGGASAARRTRPGYTGSTLLFLRTAVGVLPRAESPALTKAELRWRNVSVHVPSVSESATSATARVESCPSPGGRLGAQPQAALIAAGEKRHVDMVSVPCVPRRVVGADGGSLDSVRHPPRSRSEAGPG